jgi:hypothetical protein
MKRCDLEPYHIKGEVCRYSRLDKEIVCRKATPQIIGIKGKELSCLKKNLDNISDYVKGLIEK